MRELLTTSLRHIAKDRAFIGVFALLAVLCIVLSIYFGLRIKPSDIQVATHYTSYGGVNFYTSQWWYALSFVLFFVVIAVAHLSIALKLYSLKGRQLALGFGWFSLGLVAFAGVTLTYILNVAFPL